MNKIKLGLVGVDSGQLMISDPCYVNDFVANNFEDIRRYKNKKSGKVLEYKKDFSNYEETIPKNYKDRDILIEEMNFLRDKASISYSKD